VLVLNKACNEGSWV